MNSLSTDGASHLVPVLEVFLLLVGGVIALLVGGWKGFTWLRAGWREDLQTILDKWADAHETRHQKHELDLSEIRSQVSKGLQRVHERIDVLSDRVPPP